jgi:hypothetical protein
MNWGTTANAGSYLVDYTVGGVAKTQIPSNTTSAPSATMAFAAGNTYPVTISVLAQNTLPGNAVTLPSASAGTSTQTIDATKLPEVGTGTPTVTLGGFFNVSRTFTIDNTVFGFGTVPANTIYMPITSYSVSYCKVGSNSIAAACITGAQAASGTGTLTVGASMALTGLGAALTNSSYWKYTITAKNFVGSSQSTKVVLSR